MKDELRTERHLRDYYYAKSCEFRDAWRVAEKHVRALELEIEACRE